MELIFNPCGKFLGSVGPSSPSPHSLPPPWCPWDLFSSFKICSDAKERVGYVKQREATTPIQCLIKLNPMFLRLLWKFSLGQNCSLIYCAYSEGPALGLNTLLMIIRNLLY